MMDISIPYYEDKTRISNSNIGWFLNKGPVYLHKMLTEDVPEEKSQALERGTMIHEYILQPEEFQKDYVVWNKSRPSSAQQEKFCQALASSLEIEPNRAVLSAYKEAYSTRGKSEDLMLSEGLKIASELKEYIDFLKSNDGRIMISPWDVKMLEKIKQNIQSHKLASGIIWPRGIAGKYKCDFNINTLLHGGEITGVTFHEFHINWEYGNVKCKSLLDGITLDFRNKEVIIYDLKTTQKLWHFEDSVQTFDYCRQLCYYELAARWYLKNECEQEPGEWKVKFYIVGIDTTGSYEIRVFHITSIDVNLHKLTIDEAIIDIAWHQQHNLWEHSRAYYEGDGSETLSL